MTKLLLVDDHQVILDSLSLLFKSIADIEVVAINDLAPLDTNAHLLRYDSVHGRFPSTVTTEDNYMVIDGQKTSAPLANDRGTKDRQLAIPHLALMNTIRVVST